MSVQLYNSLTRREAPFEPLDASRVTLYVCGPTVYSHPHIGNARPAVVFDVLYRLLRHTYPSVIYARNITDVDDKINASAQAEGVGIDVISERFAAAYHADMTALGTLTPDIEPRCTHNIAPMVAMTEALIGRGCAYEAQGHVLFHVPSDPDYGCLSGRSRDDMVAGARVEVAPFKKDPADFVLWKPSTEEQPGWDSPWGRGRPGWHLECSAMIEEHLGRPIDIHGGGHDLQFPHHENEIAQTRCTHRSDTDAGELARVWMHNGFLNVDAEKMSKSLGNVLLVSQLLDEAPGEAIRLALLSASYRSPLDWSDAALAQAVRRLDRLYETLAALDDVTVSDEQRAQASPGPVLDALRADLNTPEALAALGATARRAATAQGADRAQAKAELLAGADLLGLLQSTPDEWRARRNDSVDASWVEGLLAERADARQQRDFARADAIRDQLAARGVAIKDGAGGTTWHKTA